MLFALLVLLGYLVYVNSQYAENAHCPKSNDCTWAYPYYATRTLQCISNNQCPVGFLCCADCHYQHNVCKKVIWRLPADLCPKDHKRCNRPLDYEKSKYYKCLSHVQCHKTERCCSDSCYTHNICKSVIKRSRNPKHMCPMTIRRKSCPNTNRTLNKYSCRDDDDCFSGYICCSDNCYDHMVCKLPNEAFFHQSIYKPSSYTPPASLEEHKCPEVQEKCLTPYSLRLAKKFICFKDGDCKVGQLCCKDACVKEFRMCKNLFTLKPDIYTTGGKLLTSTPFEPLTAKESVEDHTSVMTTIAINAVTVHPSYRKESIVQTVKVKSISKKNSADSVLISNKNSTIKETEVLGYIAHVNKEKEFSSEVIEDNDFDTNNADLQFYFTEENLNQEGNGFGSGAWFEFQDEED